MASGSSVWMQRTYGLDTSSTDALLANRLPSAWACFQPDLLNGRSRSSPVHIAPFARLGMPNEVDDRMCHDLSARS